ncbi:MAG: tryptophan-rich sensory protein [Clostridiales bacterium]|nr:tryptophan-rich sensory protein [Clostridiales bacterium]
MKIIVAFTFVLMIMMNALANILPINGVGTGQVSDAYGNLFAPAGITFAIWGVIYLLLGVFTVYQFKKDSNDVKREAALIQIRLWFAASSVANTLWILAWHYDFIGVSLALMVFILASLIRIALVIRATDFEGKDLLAIKIPFGVYFGWITVATIANVTTYLVSIGWDAFGVQEDIWTAGIILVGLAIGARTTTWFKDVPYGLVIIWAYLGILLKHTSADGFAGQYMRVILVTLFSLLIMAVFIYKVIYDTRHKSILRGTK